MDSQRRFRKYYKSSAALTQMLANYQWIASLAPSEVPRLLNFNSDRLFVDFEYVDGHHPISDGDLMQAAASMGRIHGLLQRPASPGGSNSWISPEAEPPSFVDLRRLMVLEGVRGQGSGDSLLLHHHLPQVWTMA